MNSSQVVISILIAMVLLNSVRLLWSLPSQARRLPLLSVLILQVLSAVLLYFTLFPPMQYASAQRLQIVTANATPNPMLSNADVRVLSLPEAARQTGVASVPDLATALRRFPGVTEIEVIGDGLPMRDWDAAQALLVRYKAPRIKQGIIELGLPLTTVPGERWLVSGRVAQTAATTIELFDPGNALVARVLTDAQGNFSHSDTARGPGHVLYQLRVLNAERKLLETLSFPVVTRAPETIRILSISGGANPELKYLKRWALDAGVSLQSSIDLGLGMQIQTAPPTFNTASLRDLDLLITDERAWMALSESSKQAVRLALAQGLGVMLRITGPLSAKARAEWRALGFNIAESDAVQMLRLFEPNQQSNLPELMRQSVQVKATDAVTLYADNQGKALGLWRAEQLGRVGVWWLNDSFRLVLTGNKDVYGAMWSQIASTLSRAKQKPNMQSTKQTLWITERAIFCGLTDDAVITPPESEPMPLLREMQGAYKNCAAFWPGLAGWHQLKSSDQSQMFYVRDTSDAVALHRSEIQQANMAFVSTQKPTVSKARVAVPGSPWPYFLAWLLATSLLWWLERRNTVSKS